MKNVFLYEINFVQLLRMTWHLLLLRPILFHSHSTKPSLTKINLSGIIGIVEQEDADRILAAMARGRTQWSLAEKMPQLGLILMVGEVEDALFCISM